MLLIASSMLLGLLLAYIWGVICVYIVSFGIPQFEELGFSDRALYAIRWPLFPVISIVVVGVMGYNFFRVVLGKGDPSIEGKPQEKGGLFVPSQKKGFINNELRQNPRSHIA